MAQANQRISTSTTKGRRRVASGNIIARHVGEIDEEEFDMFKKITLSTAAALTALVAMPAAAEAQGRNGFYESNYQQSYRGHNRGYRRCSGTPAPSSEVPGGALLGREIAGRGDRTTGTILGVAAGALLGRQVGKSTCRR
jgi:hypothetical protein